MRPIRTKSSIEFNQRCCQNVQSSLSNTPEKPKTNSLISINIPNGKILIQGNLLVIGTPENESIYELKTVFPRRNKKSIRSIQEGI
jgi:hypothetical protein